VAASLAFPDGSMTASGLRRESARGRLIIERIAGKDYTTFAHINEMRMQCRVGAKGRVCGGEKIALRTEKLSPEEHGLLSMAASISPRDALLAKIERRRNA
jgi:hypothetical protein